MPRPTAGNIRFWRFVDKRAEGECWPWLGYIERNGYARFRVTPDQFGRRGVHVYSFLLAGGELPKGWTVDHMCHDPNNCPDGTDCAHRRCVNPAHLIASSMRDNVIRGHSPAGINARKTNCKRGHPLSGANLFINVNGARVCIACRREADRRHDAKRKH